MGNKCSLCCGVGYLMQDIRYSRDRWGDSTGYTFNKSQCYRCYGTCDEPEPPSPKVSAKTQAKIDAEFWVAIKELKTPKFWMALIRLCGYFTVMGGFIWCFYNISQICYFTNKFNYKIGYFIVKLIKYIYIYINKGINKLYIPIYFNRLF